MNRLLQNKGKTTSPTLFLLISLLILQILLVAGSENIILNIVNKNITVDDNITVIGSITFNSSYYNLELFTPTNKLKFQSEEGIIEFPVYFNPQESGNHSVVLRDVFTQEIVTSDSVEVLPTVENNTQNETEEIEIAEEINETNLTINTTENISLEINETFTITSNETIVNGTNASNQSQNIDEIIEPANIIPEEELEEDENETEVISIISATQTQAELMNSKFEKLLADMTVYELENGVANVEITPNLENTLGVKLNKLNYTGNLSLKIENVNKKIFVEKKESIQSFAIDPSDLDFENGEVTRIATGTELWKCAEWNYSTQTCYGSWKKIMNIIPGIPYTININATDPGFVEILITNAVHLDENRTFISNIYNEVKEQDGIWSETIPSNDFIRVTFERKLFSGNDITIYPQIISGSPKIEVYEKDQTNIIAEFASLQENSFNKIYLTNLPGFQDTFDLKILEGSVQFDYITDPVASSFVNSTEATNGATQTTSLTVDVPLGVQEDDVMIAVLAISENEDPNTHLTTPSGWTSVISEDAQNAASQPNATVYYRIATSSEPLNYTWTNGGEITGIVGQILAYRNVGNVGGNPISQTATLDDGGVDGCPTAPSVTTANDNETVIYIGFMDDDEIPATESTFYPTNSTGREATEASSGANGLDVGLGTADQLIATSGTATGTRAFQNCIAVEEWAGITISLLPGNAPSTTPTNIHCDGSTNCNISVETTVDLNASGAIDGEGDTIVYFIEALLQNITETKVETNTSKVGILGFNATGGTITESGDFTYHTFTSNDTFEVLVGSDNVEVLIVGGGGAGGTGGTAARGGGGSGGLVYNDSFPISINTYTVLIGVGGTPGTISTTGGSGGLSSFDGITALGGGGAGPHATAGAAGGSGGGGSGYTGEAGGAGNQPGSSSGGFGNAGGASFNGGGAPGRQGGGGGTGASGQDGQSSSGGAGGVGLEYSQFSSVGGSPAGWFGGGGGGGASTGTPAGAGGQGGGGAGGSGAVGTSGTANTGGGGGGSTTTAGAGGAGVVIIRNPNIYGPLSNESNTSYTTHSDISNDYGSVTNITFIVQIDSYNPEGSVARGNIKPDLEIEVYNGSGFVSLGLFNLNDTYTEDGVNTTDVNFSFTTTNSGVLTAWETSSNQDIRIRGRFVDYFNDTTIDEINYTDIWTTINGKTWIEIGNHSETDTFDWNVSTVTEQNCVDLRARASDVNGSGLFSSYFTKNNCLNISRPPQITNPFVNASVINQTESVRLNVTITDELTITTTTVTLRYPNSTEVNISLTNSDGNIYFLDFSNTNQTGTYNFTNILAIDILGNANNSAYSTLTFEVTASPPTVFDLLLPINNTVSTNHQPNMSWEQTTEPHFANYTLLIDKDPAFGTPDFNYSNFQIDNISRVISALNNNSIYYWRVIAYDVFGSSRQSTNDFVYITDNLTPQITLNSPSNGGFVLTNSFFFNYTPTDLNLANCSLYTNQTGSFSLNQTNTTPVNEQPNNFSTNLPDGRYLWNIFCLDRANNSAFSPSNFTVLVDTNPPAINLESPANNTFENITNNIVLFYNSTDEMTTIASCEAIVDGTSESTDFSITEGTTQNITVFMDNGQHNWSINCTDSNGFETSSFIFNISVDVTSEADPPVITLNYPNPDFYSDSNSVLFNYTPNDASGIENCSIYINNQLNQTDVDVENQEINNFTIGGFSNQEYSWQVQCYDNNTFALGFSESRNFTIDLINPSVTLNTPANNSLLGSSSVLFNYTPSDTNLANCSLFSNFSGSFVSVETNSSPANAQPNGFTRTVNDGLYIWNVLCLDLATRSSYATNNFTVEVDATPPFFSNQIADPTSPTTFTFPQTYTFNITWTDSNIDTVIIEHNFTGTLQNESVASSDENFSFSTGPLAAGTYVYRWIANDTLGKTNQTSQFTYIINRATTEINLTLNQTRGDISINEDQYANITAKLITPTNGIIQIYQDGVMVNNGSNSLTNITLFSEPGVFNFTVTYNQTQNYTSGSESWLLTVNDTTNPIINLIFPENDTIIAFTDITFQYNVSDSSNILNCSLYVNDTINQTDTTILTDTTQTFAETFVNGSYTWNIQCYDVALNLGVSETRNFSVQEAPNLQVILSLNSSSYQEGELIEMTSNISDAFGNPLNSTVFIDVILANTTTAWWDSSWSRRKTINMTETDGRNRTDIAVEVNVSGLNGEISSCDNEIRIIDHGTASFGTVIERNITAGDNSNWCSVRFLADVTANQNSQSNYYAYYNNAGASDPGTSINISTIFYTDDGENGTQRAQWTLDYLGTDTSTCGWWAWYDPNGYLNGGADAQPDDDVTGGTGVNALFTGPNGTNADCTGTDGDIDGPGFTTMSGPTINLSGWTEVKLRVHRWYYSNDNSADNDDRCMLNASSNAGGEYNYTIFDLSDDDIGGDPDGYNQWTQVSFDLHNILPITSQYSMVVYGDDLGNGDIVECGFDEFSIEGHLSNVQTNIGDSQSLITKVQNSTGLDGIWVYTFDSLNQQIENYSVISTASAENFANNSDSTSFELLPDTTPPNITLNLPIDSFNTSSTDVLFNWTSNDYQRNQTCNLTIDSVINQSNVFLNNSDISNFTINNFYEGTHYWNVTCIDPEGNSNTSETRSFFVDLTGPNIILNLPIDSENTSSTLISFNWTASDNRDPSPLCNITVNSVVEASSITSSNNTPVSQNVTLTTGTKAWNVTCIDLVSNTGSSNTRSFVILSPPLSIVVELLSNEQDVRINWTPITEAQSYNIYFSENFTQGFAGPNTTGITDTNYTDTVANQTYRRFYLVSSVRGNSEANSTVYVGKYDKNLSSSFNLVSFPFVPNVFELKNSTNNGYEFALQPNCLASLWRYNTTGFLRTDWDGAAFTPASGSENFTSLNVTQGYWVETNQSCELTFVGQVPNQGFNMSLADGLTLVSWYSAEEKELPTDSNPVLINVTPNNAIQTIDRYNAETGEFEVTVHFDIGGTPWGWFPSFNNPDFTEMDPTYGYYFDTTPIAVWNHEP